MAPPRLLGIDVGTTALKAAIVDAEGDMLGAGVATYSPPSGAPGVERDAHEYWQAVGIAVRGALATAGDADEIAALAISSQGETLVAVDRHGRPTRNAIVWLDNRAVEEAEMVAQALGEEVYARTGQPEVVPTWPAAKILWIRQHEPGVFAATDAFLLLEDYLVSRLTGDRVGSRCLYSSSLLLDVGLGSWWEAMLDVVGIESSRLPRLAESGEVIGELRSDAAQHLGLRVGTPVVAGGLDQVVAAAAAGMAPGVTVESTGSALAVTAPVPELTLDAERRLPCHLGIEPGAYCLLSWAQTAGLAIEWSRNLLFPDDGDAFATLDREADSVPPAADGLVALPHFEGAACPEFDPRARAVIFGLTLRHGRGHIARALMEAVAFSLRANLDLVETVGLAATELRSIGGGSRSRVWLQIKADVLQRPIVPLEAADAGCLGAAAIAGLGAGIFDDLHAAVSSFDRLGQAVEPDVAHATTYDDLYQRYRDLYEALAPMFRKEPLYV